MWWTDNEGLLNGITDSKVQSDELWDTIQRIRAEIDNYYEQLNKISYLIHLYGSPNYASCSLFDEYQDIQIILQYRERALEECKNEYHGQ